MKPKRLVPRWTHRIYGWAGMVFLVASLYFLWEGAWLVAASSGALAVLDLKAWLTSAPRDQFPGTKDS